MKHKNVVCATVFLISGLIYFATAARGDLVAYWAFNENGGTIAKDASENGNDGALMGAKWVTGKSGSGLEFDGKAAIVEIADDPTLNFTEKESMTIAVWVSIKEKPAGPAWIVGKAGNLPAHYLFGYHSTPQNIRLKLDDGGTDLKLDSVTDIYDGKWHHLTAVRDRSKKQARIYVDGKLDVEAQDNTGDTTNDAVLHIGQRGDNGQFFPAGARIDELAIWDEPLTAAEIKRVFDGSLLAGILAVNPEGMLAITWGHFKQRED